MKITAYDASESAKLKELRETAALEKRADAPVWIDVTDYAPEELTEWLSSLRLDRDWGRASAEMSGRTRLEVADAEIFFELSVLGKGPRAVWQPMAFLCARGVVITIHPQPMEDLAEVVDRIVRNGGSPLGDNSSMVAALLAALSRRTVEMAADVRDAMRDVQKRLDDDPDQVAVDEIQDLSTVIRTLDRIVGERSVILDRLQVLEGRALDLADLTDFRVAFGDTRYLDRVIDRLEKGVIDLRVRFSVHQQDRTNRRLAILTVLSAVFLPLTLLAGIYGMNFEFMPELGYRYAYFVALGAMAVIAIGMTVYFRRRGWFD